MSAQSGCSFSEGYVETRNLFAWLKIDAIARNVWIGSFHCRAWISDRDRSQVPSGSRQLRVDAINAPPQIAQNEVTLSVGHAVRYLVRGCEWNLEYGGTLRRFSG